MPRKRTVVDFSEIFDYAKKKHVIEWNAANRMFFRGVLEYKRTHEFYLLDGIWSDILPGFDYNKPDDELKSIIADFKFDHSKAEDYENDYSKKAGRIIINQFAIENNLPEEFLILCG